MKLIDFRKETDTWVLFKFLDTKNGKLESHSTLQEVKNMFTKEEHLMMMYDDFFGFEYFEVIFRNGDITNYMRPIKTKRALKKYTEYLV